MILFLFLSFHHVQICLWKLRMISVHFSEDPEYHFKFLTASFKPKAVYNLKGEFLKGAIYSIV